MIRLRILAFVLALSGMAATPVVLADNTWENSVSVVVSVNGHAFHDAKIEGSGCTLKAELRFLAPENGYADPKNKVRNHHSFQPRLKFAKGQTLTGERFGNSAAGERVWHFESDTTADECWGKAPNKIVKVDVIGCRGVGCDIGAFE
jgi:hypothetical protein